MYSVGYEGGGNSVGVMGISGEEHIALRVDFCDRRVSSHSPSLSLTKQWRHAYYTCPHMLCVAIEVDILQRAETACPRPAYCPFVLSFREWHIHMFNGPRSRPRAAAQRNSYIGSLRLSRLQYLRRRTRPVNRRMFCSSREGAG